MERTNRSGIFQDDVVAAPLAANRRSWAIQTARRTHRNRRVLVHGHFHCARMFAELMSGDGWEFRYYPDCGLDNLAAMARELYACDIAYQIGGRVTMGKFLWASKILGKKRIVMHWVGTDALDERDDTTRRKYSPWITGAVSHWANSDWLTKEVNALGVSCEQMPLPSSFVPEQPSTLPDEFCVLVYTPDVDRSYLYGLDRILQVAWELPHIRFDLVGLVNGPVLGPPPNLHIHGRTPDIADFYKRASVVWRPARHDGLSFMVMEALGYGRHVLWSYEFPGCLRVEGPSEARAEICRLHALHQERRLKINSAGVKAIADGGYHPQVLRRRILNSLEEILAA